MKVGGMSEANQSEAVTSALRTARTRASRIGAILLIVLLAVVAVQSARLLWALVTPAGPIGKLSASAANKVLVLGDFDPFFRLAAPAASSSVTSLPLKLFGTRRDSATGQGSAIIATPDGVQSSFAIGEMIMPGVTLAAVANDEVTIDRGGAKEKLFLDQSIPAPVALPSTPPIQPSIQTAQPRPADTANTNAPPLIVPDRTQPPSLQTMEQQ